LPPGLPSARLPSRDAFRRYAAHFDEQTSKLIDQLASGELSVDAWLTAMEKEVNGLHTTAYVLGVGGVQNMTQEDLDHVQVITDRQMVYLRRWADQIRADLAAGNEINYEAMKPRARLYRNAANATLQNATTAHMGIPDLPAYSGDGTSECLTNDACSWRIEKLPGDGNFDAYWTLSEAEHCETCLKRAQVWNPLQIRAGVIQPYDATGLFATH
jgi:hypothetical protein